MRIGLLVITLIILTGCATQQPTPVLSKQKRAYSSLAEVEKNKPHYQLSEGEDPALESAFNRYLETGRAPNIITEGFIKIAYQANQQPIIKAAPFQETVVSLEAGEHFTSISSGDPSRWSYAVATSGSGNQQQQNVLIKPSFPNISTNMVITTDKRIYNIRLISSQQEKITRSVSFWYPEEMMTAARNSRTRQLREGADPALCEVNLSHLNFNYSISSPFFSRTPSWKPTRVFDDGTHTYIEFPTTLNKRDMPVLFVQEGNEQQLVNYHVKSPHFVVDKIFHTAVLVMGVGSAQSKITITNHRY